MEHSDFFLFKLPEQFSERVKGAGRFFMLRVFSSSTNRYMLSLTLCGGPPPAVSRWINTGRGGRFLLYGFGLIFQNKRGGKTAS